MLKTILGLLKPTQERSGSTASDLRAPAHDVVKKRIALVPRAGGCSRLSVNDNLVLGPTRSNRRPRSPKASTWCCACSVIKERGDQRAGTLSGGEQQQVAIARGSCCARSC